MLSDLKVTAIALAIGLGAGALGSWYLTAKYKDSVWGKAVADQKVEAVAQLQAATQLAIEAEREGIALALKLEVQSAENKQKLDSILADNRRLARELGGLRDPFAKPAGGCTMPAAPAGSGIAVPAPAPGRLSDEASEFLLDFASDADRAAEYAATCHEWVKQIDGRR